MMSDPFTSDSRGVSEVIGAILVFGLVVLLLGIVQVTAIPQANEDVEFSHSQRVQDDIQRLASDTVAAAQTGGDRTATVKTGVQYPPRLLFLNPPPVSGAVRVQPAGTLAVANARAVDPDAADYVDGGWLNYTTASVVYDPAYNVYGGAPTTVYDGFGVYNSHPSGEQTVLTSPDFVDGRDVSLLALRGSTSRSAVGTTTLGLHPVSSGTDPLLVEGAGDQRVSIVVPTSLPVDHWRTALADERVENGGHVDEINAVPAGVEVVLEEGITYRLRGSAVRVGSGTAAESAPPAYVSITDGDGATVGEGGTHQVTVSARDRHGNPVAGETVMASVTDGSLESRSVTTRSDGSAVFTYEAPADVTEDTEVRFDASVTVDPDETTPDESAPLNATAAFVVPNGSVVRTSLGNTINPGGTGDVLLVGSSISSDDCGNTDCNVTMNFDNTGSDPVELEEVRYNFYSKDSQGQGVPGRSGYPSSARLDGHWLEVRGPFVTIDGPTLDVGTDTVSIRFYESADTSSPFKVLEGDFFVISVEFSVDGETRTAMYFVAPGA